MKRIVFYLCFLTFIAQASFAQPRFDLTTGLRKYWKTRGRLIGDPNNRDKYNGFMVVGDQFGMSIPAEHRRKNTTGYEVDVSNSEYGLNGGCSNQMPLPVIDIRDGDSLKGQMVWGDATIQLAHYIIALAYEYNLLSITRDPGINGTIEELYYALNALRRLDIWGETKIPAYQTNIPLYNGFYVRDDVPGDFARRWMGKEYDLVRSDASCGDGIGNEMSYDQQLAIQLALTMVDKMVPPNVNFNGENLYGLNQVLSFMINLKLSLSPLGIIFGNQGVVSRGAFNPMGYYPMILSARQIAKNPFLYQSDFNDRYCKFVWETILTGFATSQASTAVIVGRIIANPILGAAIITSTQVLGNGPVTDNTNDNINMFLQAGVAGRCMGVIYYPDLPFVPPYFDPMGVETVENAGNKYKKKIYKLFNATLIGYPYQDYNYWQNELAKYPCGGSCTYIDAVSTQEEDENGCVNINYTPTASHPRPGDRQNDPDEQHMHPWTTSNRWEHWARNFQPDAYREYAGVDYLEAFNAYLYHMRPYMGMSAALRNRLTSSYPAWAPTRTGTWLPVGTKRIPLYYRSVFELAVTSKFNARDPNSAYASLQAGSNVDLLPGFEAAQGSMVDIKIKDFDCKDMDNLAFAGPSLGTHLKTAGEEEELDTADIGVIWAMNADTMVGVRSSDSLQYVMPDTIRSLTRDSGYVRSYFKPGNDTLYIEMDSCWAIDSNNMLVNICDAQNRPLSTQKLSLNAARLYPVPARNELFLDIGLGATETLLVQILDVLGRDVTNSCTAPTHRLPPGGATLRFNTSSLAPGTYLLRLRMAEATESRTFTILP